MKDFDAQKLSSLIQKFCNQLFNVVDIIWDEKKYIKQPDRFFYTILMKVTTVLDSIHFQIFNLDQKPNYAVATGLVLRTCLLDIINLYYVLDLIEDEPQMLERINSIMADHLKYVYKNLKSSEQAEVRKDWPELFDSNNLPKTYQLPNSKRMADAIINFPSIKTEAEGAQHTYSLLSKYEHNGAFTFDLLHNPYSERGGEIVKRVIKNGLDTCVIALKTVCGHWIDEKDNLEIELGKTVQEIINL